MLGLSANLKYYLFNGNVDMRKGIFRLCEQIRTELSMDPGDTTIVYMFMSKSRKIVKLLHYERGFYVLYEKRPVQGKFKKPVFDELSRSYQISWSDMAYLTESLVIDLHFSKATLNRYMQNGLRILREYMEDSMRREVISTDYIMTDETTELVGVKGENGGKSYRKKYLWAFYAQLKKIVYYLYESGSRARKVVVDFLTDFSGFISTDGYVAYSIFDDAEKHPGIVHIGCWVHARRKFIDALPSDRRAMEIINMIAELFRLELTFKVQKLSPDQIKVRRERRSGTILRRIHDRVVLLSTDLKLMANEMMSNAVNYMLNQWKSLENFIKDGRVQISNNLCEQRMKPVKLNLKNCQNIGSEDAAKNTAFIFSLTESCRLNGINPETYLEKLFKCIVSHETYDKRQLLPCYIKI